MNHLFKNLWVASFQDTIILFDRDSEPTFHEPNSLTVLLRDFNNCVSPYYSPEELTFKFFEAVVVCLELNKQLQVGGTHKFFEYNEYTHFHVCHNGFMKTLEQYMVALKEKAQSEETAKNIARLEKNLDFIKIQEMFEKVDLKKPIIRLVIEGAEFKISKAPAHGFNKGFLYLNVDKEYIGKISPEGKFEFNKKLVLSEDRKIEILENLHDLAFNPKAKMIEYGRETGCCGLCGRKLTDKNSIEIGIGPICLENWGM